MFKFVFCLTSLFLILGCETTSPIYHPVPRVVSPEISIDKNHYQVGAIFGPKARLAVIDNERARYEKSETNTSLTFRKSFSGDFAADFRLNDYGAKINLTVKLPQMTLPGEFSHAVNFGGEGMSYKGNYSCRRCVDADGFEYDIYYERDTFLGDISYVAGYRFEKWLVFGGPFYSRAFTEAYQNNYLDEGYYSYDFDSEMIGFSLAIRYDTDFGISYIHEVNWVDIHFADNTASPSYGQLAVLYRF